MSENIHNKANKSVETKPTNSDQIGTNQANNPSSQLCKFPESKPLHLDVGQKLGPWQIAYQTYGTLNQEKTNAILVCHALTGDQYVASTNPVTQKPGWWSKMVGPELPIDTNKFFVICANVLGGCLGTTGPASINEKTGKPYGLDFPVVTIKDMVRAQAALLDELEIETLFCVTGGSMGGMQALQWAVEYPKRVFSAIPIAAGPLHSSQNIAFHEVGRQAVMADPNWHGGKYDDMNTRPVKGLSVARMAAHITYMSETSLQNKFGRSLQDRDKLTFSFDADFQIESYLRHQGITFVDRFDANSYLYVTRAMDYFDLATSHNGSLVEPFIKSETRFCIMSFTSDWLFPTSESKEIVKALNKAGANVSFVEIESDKGHDSFLLEVPEMFATIRGFLHGAANARGITPPALSNS